MNISERNAIDQLFTDDRMMTSIMSNINHCTEIVKNENEIENQE